MRIDAELLDAGPLVDAELVLLVDDDERELGELDIVLDQRLRADGNVDLSIGQRFAPAGGFLGLGASRRRGGEGL